MSVDPGFLAKFDSLPVGGYGGTAYGKRWRVTKTVMAGGRSQKLEAEELGGTGYVSMNLYRLAGGAAILKPCEMPEDEVLSFLAALNID
ncbi:MAG: hypothetical protein QNJ13_01835 [Paracoccaceae bacterium]|nr:hypothetical protein [Paracoccaceae bacterium]